MDTSFIDKCISGDALLDEVDDYIDFWHEDSTFESVELYEYLGMTWSEYSLWMTTPSALNSIVNARRNGHSLENAPVSDMQALVTRAASPEEAQHVMDWLDRLGKLNKA